MDNTPVQLMKITLDGEVVAELPLYIYDAQKAWEAFTTSYAEIIPHLVGEFFQAMRIGCREDLQQMQKGQYVGLNVDINTGIHPKLVIPTNFPPGGF